jgi:hypothetical protein
MKPYLLLFYSALMIIFTSCVPLVRKIHDEVRNVTMYQWSNSKLTSSKINRISRSFTYSLNKEGINNKNLKLEVLSSFPVTQDDYQDTAYIITNDTILKVQFIRLEDIKYQEQINNIQTTTATTTNVKTESVTSIEPVKSTESTENRSEKIKNTNTTTSTSTNTDTKVDTKILNKVLSKRIIQTNDNETFIKTLRAPKTTIRIYNTNKDFWDIKLLAEEKAQIAKLLNNVSDVIVR